MTGDSKRNPGDSPAHFVSGRARLGSLGLAVAFALAGLQSMRALPDVSTWANLPVLTSFPIDSTDCSQVESYSAVRSTFFTSDGTAHEPAARFGTKVVFPSFRTLDRDIGGTFKAQLSNADGRSFQLADFSFAEGQFDSVRAGCRVAEYTIHFNQQQDSALDRVGFFVNAHSVPTEWTLLQVVEIDGGKTESWVSEPFWLVPANARGLWARDSVFIDNPFFESETQ